MTVTARIKSKIRSERLHVGSTEEKVNLDLKGQFKGIPLALSGSLDNANIMIDNKPSNVGFDGHFGEAKLVVRGTAGPLVPAVNLDITVDVNTDSMAVFSPLAGQELPNLGPLSVSFKLAGKQGRYSLSELLAQLKDQTLTAEARGSITDLANLSGLKVQAWVNTGQMAKLMKKLGIRTDITLPNSVKAEVVTEGNLNELALKQFKADIQGRGFSATGSGQAKNIITLDGAKASFTVEAESLDFIAGIAKTKLPSLGPLKASANITSTGKNLEAMEIDANLASDKIQANISGSVVDPINLKKVNAVVDLGIESFDWLSEYIETKLPPLGALKASAKIVSKGKTFEVKEINADLTGGKIQAKMAGSVKDVLKLAGINANVNFNADSLAALNPIVKAELPASGPVTLEAKISSKGVLKGPATIATVFKGDGVTAKLSGSIAEPLSAKGIDMAIAVEADSLEKVGTLAAINLKGKNPLKLEGRLIGSEKSYELAGLRLQSDGLDIKGQAAYKLPTELGGRPKATGKIHLGTLDLPKLQGRQATPSPEKESSPESRDDESKPKKVFSSEPLPFGTLKALDANFHLTVESLTTSQLLLEDGEANLVLENGLLNVKPIWARVGQGQLVGYVTLDAGKKPAFLDVDVELTDGTFRNFGGKMHFLVDLKGSGDSIASIMAGLDGHLEFDVRGATLKKSFMTKFGTGLLDSFESVGQEKRYYPTRLCDRPVRHQQGNPRCQQENCRPDDGHHVFWKR